MSHSAALKRGDADWLSASYALVMLPHVLRVPWWLGALIVSAALARPWLARHVRHAPSRWVVAAAGIAITVAVFAQYGTIVGREPGVALLLAMSALKLVETRTQREAALLVFLLFFVAVSVFLFSQVIALGLYVVASTWVLCATLIGFNRGDREPGLRERVVPAATLVVHALPLMAVLFVLFPRIQGPLWSLPPDRSAARTGLSDSMSPGSISRLIESDEIVMRIEFDQGPPARNQLYFRGPVLWRFDGHQWTPRVRREALLQPKQASQRAIVQRITLEPTQRAELYALEFPTNLPKDAQLTRDGRLVLPSPVGQRRQYEVISRAATTLSTELLPTERRDALQLPPSGNPRARALAAELASRHAGDTSILRAALDAFVKQALQYTFEPPEMPDDTVDRFLFVERRGFCEHFAGALTFVLRAAGVPARVVTGYQGGEFNDIDRHLTVRQSDAHAWVEVWLEGTGWTRVDPTAIVQPVRIDSGIDALVPGRTSVFGVADWEWVRALRHGWSFVNYQWSTRILGYSFERQRSVLASFGVSDATLATLVAWTVGVGLAALALTAAIVLFQRRAVRADPARALWQTFARKLARRGVALRNHEGPIDLARRATQLAPSLSDEINGIAELYASLRYGAPRSGVSLTELRRRVRAF